MQIESNANPRVHLITLNRGIRRASEFERKGLAHSAVNAGSKCGHDCLYCSTGTVLRRDKSFRQAEESPFEGGYAIVDPSAPQLVARQAKRMRSNGVHVIQLSTFVDAWAPEAQKYDIGRQCLEAILLNSDCHVRILTKNAAVARDFDFIERYRERVMVGLSLTATITKANRVAVTEPYASPIKERLEALRQAHRRGLRTYGMLCPLLPGIADSEKDIRWLVEQTLKYGAEEVFVEPVNARGKGLRLTAEGLRSHGFEKEADAVEAIRVHANWSGYVRRVLASTQLVMREHHALDKLRFLLYPANLTTEDGAYIRKHDAGVKWLGAGA